MVGLWLWPAAPADGRIKEKVATFTFKVRLTLKSQAALTAKDVKYAALPSGKHVGLSYTGVTDPKTIAHYTRMGFRTSVSVTPATSAEAIRALEDAGADLVVGYGMAKSEMGLTPQEAFDGSTMWRVNLLKKSRGSVAIGSYYNMRVRYGLPVNRRMGRYLYTIHDSNFLACNSWAVGYSILVGRNRTPEQMVRPHNANRVRSAPNTLVYYQTVGNILQGIVEMMDPGEVTTITLR
ncbi:unnamed protein product, partial [marine sediment metagenome]